MHIHLKRIKRQQANPEDRENQNAERPTIFVPKVLRITTNSGIHAEGAAFKRSTRQSSTMSAAYSFTNAE